ncbi:MAG: signal recognition particle-docking protein FtsY [Erysipelotrichaceae bacterium]|nr:signal recognition particle-docking protein FtsY [Erysipelotrichaceae bacterium]
MSFFSALRNRLKPKTTDQYVSGFERTQIGFGSKLKILLKGSPLIDEKVYAQINDVLLKSDLGVECASQLIRDLKKQAKALSLTQTEELIEGLTQLMRESFKSYELTLKEGTNVFLIVGINGSGKTTTVAKLAYSFKAQGKSVVMIAADTFRAAAVQQLQTWSDRLDIPCISGKENADPSSVVVDGLRYAQEHKTDIVLIDTAGRLQNKVNLMEELSKINRVITKIHGSPPEFTWMVLDGSTGQHGLKQAESFKALININGILCTKLDGTAKGGILVALSQKLDLPIPYIGLGEKLEDLVEFDPDAFIYSIIRELT